MKHIIDMRHVNDMFQKDKLLEKHKLYKISEEQCCWARQRARHRPGRTKDKKPRCELILWRGFHISPPLFRARCDFSTRILWGGRASRR